MFKSLFMCFAPMYFIDSLIKGAANALTGGFIGNFFGEKQDERRYEMSEAASAKQWEREYGAYKTRYQDTMSDMSKAGLNPILAAGSGFNVGSGPSASTPSTPTGAPQITDIASSGLDVYRTQTEKEKKKETQASTELKKKQALETIAKTLNQRAQAGKARQDERTSVARMFEAEQRTAKLGKEIRQVEAQTELTYKQRENLAEMKKQIIATVARLKAETAKLKQIAKVYDGPIGAILAYTQEIMRSIGVPVTAAILKKGGR